MSGRPRPALALVGFLVGKSAANFARTRLRRLRQPRYLVALALGAFYFWSVLGGPTSRRPARWKAFGHGELDVFLLGASYAVTAIVLLSWIFRKAKAALPLSEADVAFLFPAPLSRRSVLHFALIRTQLVLAASSLFLSFVLRRGTFGGGGLRAWVSTWLVLTAFHLHGQVVSFTKARWDEAPDARRRFLRGAGVGAAALLLVLLAVAAADRFVLARTLLADGVVSSGRELLEALRLGIWGTVGGVLVFPARLLLSPIGAPDGAALLRALPGALAVVGLLYAALARSAVRFEEATLQWAARLAALRAGRAAGGRLLGAAPLKARHVVPFALAPSGRPEVAIVWKNLLVTSRRKLSTRLALVPAAGAFGFLAGALATRLEPGLFDAAATGGVLAFVGSTFVSLLSPLGLRADLRADLANADAMRLWPISARGLVAAEMAAPFLQAVSLIWACLAVGLGSFLGGRLFAPAPDSWEGPLESAAAAVGLASGLALLLPALSALVLVVQNAAVAALPAWFPPGLKRSQGLEATGGRLLSFLVTLVFLALGLLPAAAIVFALFWFAPKPVSPALLPFAGFFASLPLWAEAAVGVFGVAALYERFDPSLDVDA